MTTYSMHDVQQRLPAILSALQPGEEVFILQDEQRVARLIAEPRGELPPRQPGSAKGQLIVISEDDEHLQGFADYMPCDT